MSLIVTCARNLENDASDEIKNILVEMGDENPQVEISDMPGILTVKTELDPVQITKKIREKIVDEPWSLRYCLRLIPIQDIVATEIDEISDAVQKFVDVIEKSDSYRISVEKRNSDISTKDIITKIANNISNKVSLENPDWVVLVEILGNKSGVAVLKKDDIVSVEIVKRSFSD